MSCKHGDCAACGLAAYTVEEMRNQKWFLVGDYDYGIDACFADTYPCGKARIRLEDDDGAVRTFTLTIKEDAP